MRLNFQQVLWTAFLIFFFAVTVDAAPPYLTHDSTVDMEKAVSNLTGAAHAGDAEAQHDLALHFAYGQGVDKDLQQAFTWLKKAADQNLAISQLLIAEGS